MSCWLNFDLWQFYQQSFQMHLCWSQPIKGHPFLLIDKGRCFCKWLKCNQVSRKCIIIRWSEVISLSQKSQLRADCHMNLGLLIQEVLWRKEEYFPWRYLPTDFCSVVIINLLSKFVSMVQFCFLFICVI